MEADLKKVAGIARQIEENVLGKYTDDELREMIALVDGLRAMENLSGHERYFVPGTPFGIDKLPKHAAFFAAGATYKERAAISGNRCGKSFMGCFETALHLTGKYPSWWVGKRFDKPVRWWTVGDSNTTVRETLQDYLIGQKSDPGIGLIPKKDILHIEWRHSAGGAADYALVRHAPTNGVSKLVFKTYEQEVKSFYGAQIDGAHIDEEPPALIYNEIFTRTMTTKGIIILTFTPLKGYTPLVLEMLKDSHDITRAA